MPHKLTESSSNPQMSFLYKLGVYVIPTWRSILYFTMSSLNNDTKPVTDAVDGGLEQAFASMSLSQVEDLQCQEQKRLLDVIDSLRDLGIEDLQTKIPQLIVCGGQSTGKSSVLVSDSCGTVASSYD
jgi:hypothetical protein